MHARTLGSYKLPCAQSSTCHMWLPCSKSGRHQEVPCASCNKQVSTATFTRWQLTQHFAAGRPLVCQACQHDGCTFRNPYRYQCTEPSCGQFFGCKGFKRTQLHRYLKKTSTRLLCIKCAETKTFTCEACRRRWKSTVFDAKQLKAHISCGKHLVCPACQQEGCSSKNPKRYRCTGPSCGKALGHRAFDRRSLNSHIKRSTSLLCKTCRAKLQLLKAKAKASNQKRCNCRRASTPIETCPKHGSKATQYFWCDVMKEPESLWLQEYLATKRRKR